VLGPSGLRDTRPRQHTLACSDMARFPKWGASERSESPLSNRARARVRARVRVRARARPRARLVFVSDLANPG